MIKKLVPVKNKPKVVIKASLLNPKNLFVLVTGIIAGIVFSPILIPVGLVAYGALCYLDLSSAEFVKKVLDTQQSPSKTTFKYQKKRPFFGKHSTLQLKREELQNLRGKIFTIKEKIRQLYDDTDDFTRRLLGDFSQTESLVEKSDQFLQKAQNIRDYLSSENETQIRGDITSLQEKIHQVSDDFSKQQYQQALDARHKHLETLRELQQIYERLVSQVTNISISLESVYSRMMKMKTLDYSLASAESTQVASQLDAILQEVEQLDSALRDTLSLPG